VWPWGSIWLELARATQAVVLACSCWDVVLCHACWLPRFRPSHPVDPPPLTPHTRDVSHSTSAYTHIGQTAHPPFPPTHPPAGHDPSRPLLSGLSPTFGLPSPMQTQSALSSPHPSPAPAPMKPPPPPFPIPYAQAPPPRPLRLRGRQPRPRPHHLPPLLARPSTRRKYPPLPRRSRQRDSRRSAPGWR
jgi:hypothetical protein